MYFLFTDETNQQRTEQAPFFIYGGVFISAPQLIEVHRLIEGIRARRGFQATDSFKFALHDRPDQVTVDDFREAKRELIEGCRDIGVIFVADVTLHAIAESQGVGRTIQYGANTVISTFNQFLAERNDHGICFMDRTQGGHAYLKAKFQTGLDFPNGNTIRLSRIVQFAPACDGSGHGMSVIDVLLGAFRWCVNERDRTDASTKMLPPLVQMMWTYADGRLVDRGLILRPRNVKFEPYRDQYIELAEHLQGILDLADEQDEDDVVRAAG